MKIAQIAPLYESVPPRLYGGTERIVGYLSDALVQLGHEVTLFAAGGEATRAHVVPSRDQPLRLDPHPLKSDLAAHMAMLHHVRARAEEFDAFHFHLDMLHFGMFEHLASRTLTTLHGRLDMKDLPAVYARWPRFPLVSISNHQRAPLPFANWVATVPHGLPRDLYQPPVEPRADYLAFVGRICPDKGPHRAIEVARRAGMPLRIAAKVDPVDEAWFREVIEPELDDPLVEFLGEVNDAEKGEVLGHAAATLFPISWPEPFGLVMIESLACGTPVIAWNCGSVPEVLEDRLTGVLVDSVEGAVDALGVAAGLDRGRIREEFEGRFSATTMARRYLEIYGALPAEDAGGEQLLEAV